MKTIDVHINARSGQVARDILGTWLKRDLRPGGAAHERGYRQFDIGHADEVALRPHERVSMEEVVADRAVLRTFVVTTHLYTADEAVESWA